MTEIDKLREPGKSQTVGGGKSETMITTQQGNLLAENRQRIAEARARGDKAEVARLQERRNKINEIAKKYKENIRTLVKEQRDANKEFKLSSTNLGKARKAETKAVNELAKARKSGNEKTITEKTTRAIQASTRVVRAETRNNRAINNRESARNVAYDRNLYQRGNANFQAPVAPRYQPSTMPKPSPRNQVKTKRRHNK